MDLPCLFTRIARRSMYLSIQVECTSRRVSTLVELPTWKTFLTGSVAFLSILCAYLALAHLSRTALNDAGKLRAGRPTVPACLGHRREGTWPEPPSSDKRLARLGKYAAGTGMSMQFTYSIVDGNAWVLNRVFVVALTFFWEVRTGRVTCLQPVGKVEICGAFL